jgi:hypothetical protein
MHYEAHSSRFLTIQLQRTRFAYASLVMKGDNIKKHVNFLQLAILLELLCRISFFHPSFNVERKYVSSVSDEARWFISSARKQFLLT